MGQSARVPLPPIGDGTALHRALRTRKESEELREAFFLRAGESDGLSVNYNCTADRCRKKLKKSYGAVTLFAGGVRQVGMLDVVPDDLEHACITGVPHKDQDAGRAEWIASQLLSLVTDTKIEFWKRPE